MMDPEVKTSWVNALRSGEFKQGSGALRTFDLTRAWEEGQSPNYLHCCLGVLCELHAKATGTEWHGAGAGAYLGERTVLPAEVVEWAGMRDHNPTIWEHTDAEGSALSLAAINDSGVGFGEIGGLIEQADL